VKAEREATGVENLIVVLPAYNEEEALGNVLAELRSIIPHTDVLVVSDGSTDGTASIARDHGVRLLELPFNLGVGGAMRAGFKYARRHGYRAAVQLDADGQHDPAEVKLLLRTAAETGADVVIGARFAGKGFYDARGPRRWAITSLAWMLSHVAKTNLTDTTSGFKLIGPRALELYSRDFPVEYLGDTVEAIVIAARNGLVVRQVPVAMRPRAGGSPSHGHFKAFVLLLRASLALAASMSRTRPTALTCKEGPIT
jgi:glycosyltransferase involved in cell wall biosynthesis